MLEDDFNDVLGKAFAGLGLNPSTVAKKHGLQAQEISSLLAGTMRPQAIQKIAPILKLDTDKLINLEHYSPTVDAPAQLHTIVSPFGHLGVNAFIVETTKHLLIFDTGMDSTNLMQFIDQHSDKEPHLFITHGHYDHTDGIPLFTKRNIPVTHPQDATSATFADIQLKALDVAGHCNPATAYFLESELFSAPLCIIGDAIFAGSMGKCHTTAAYTTAHANIRENIFTLPKETIICPGHGPLTTIAQELANNPFF